MTRAAYWRIAALVVLAASIAIAWRLSPRSPVPRDPQPPVPKAPSTGIHAAATGPAYLGPGAAPSSLKLLGKAPWLYQLDKPTRTWALPKVLDSVSDISLTLDSKSLWAVNDEVEKGTIYRVVFQEDKDASVAQTIEFGPRGDYEGIVVTPAGVMVARADGKLFLIDVQGGATTTVDSHLGPECELEGLAWAPTRKRVLLACKSAMPKLPHARKSTAIYALDLETKRVQAQPVIVLPRQAIDDYVGTHQNQVDLHLSMGDEFAPRAIAVHPTSGAIFLLSARGTMLVVLDPSGTLRRVSGLDATANPQPEGMSFGSDGTLYISNKSRGRQARLASYAEVKEPPDEASR